MRPLSKKPLKRPNRMWKNVRTSRSISVEPPRILFTSIIRIFFVPIAETRAQFYARMIKLYRCLKIITHINKKNMIEYYKIMEELKNQEVMIWIRFLWLGTWAFTSVVTDWRYSWVGRYSIYRRHDWKEMWGVCRAR